MRQFAWGAIGVLCLAVAFHLGATTAGSSSLDFGATGIIAIDGSSALPYWLLDENGDVWRLPSPGVWEIDSDYPDIPVPASSVKYWDSYRIVTVDDHLWSRDWTGVWTDWGAWPGSASPSQRSSWGKIKAKFK